MLCSSSENTIPQLLVDFWEALLVVSSQEEILQELLLRVISQYVWRISKKQLPETKPLKTTEDLVSYKPHRGSFRTAVFLQNLSKYHPLYFDSRQFIS